MNSNDYAPIIPETYIDCLRSDPLKTLKGSVIGECFLLYGECHYLTDISKTENGATVYTLFKEDRGMSHHFLESCHDVTWSSSHVIDIAYKLDTLIQEIDLNNCQFGSTVTIQHKRRKQKSYTGVYKETLVAPDGTVIHGVLPSWKDATMNWFYSNGFQALPIRNLQELEHSKEDFGATKIYKLTEIEVTKQYEPKLIINTNLLKVGHCFKRRRHPLPIFYMGNFEEFNPTAPYLFIDINYKPFYYSVEDLTHTDYICNHDLVKELPDQDIYQLRRESEQVWEQYNDQEYDYDETVSYETYARLKELRKNDRENQCNTLLHIKQWIKNPDLNPEDIENYINSQLRKLKLVRT